MSSTVKTKTQRFDKPHPIDFRDLKVPLMKVGSKIDRSIPSMVRLAVREWLQKYHPEYLND